MVFIQKTVDADRSFGAELSALRELRGWTREELSRATGIHVSTIALLETDRFDELHDPAYAERHVRTLAKALEGKVGFFLGKYRESLERAGVNASEYTGASFVRRSRRTDFFVPSRYFAVLALIPLGLAMAWYVWHQTIALTAPPLLELSSPSDGTTVDVSYVRVSGKTDSAAAVAINGIPAVVELDGTFSYQFDLPRGLTRLAVVSRRRYGGRTELVRYVTYEPAISATTTTKLDISATTTPAGR